MKVSAALSQYEERKALQLSCSVICRSLRKSRIESRGSFQAAFLNAEEALRKAQKPHKTDEPYHLQASRHLHGSYRTDLHGTLILFCLAASHFLEE